MSLGPRPTHMSYYGEIAVQYQPYIADYYDKLTPAERIFAYYLFRASLPGNSMLAEQIHRHNTCIIQLFQQVVMHAHTLDADYKDFIEQARIYLVFLWSNHGCYFMKEEAHNKRTPQQLGLTQITQDRLKQVLAAIDRYSDWAQKVDAVAQILFDPEYEHTLTVPNSIDQSAVNLYSPDVTDGDYEHIAERDKNALNAYFYREGTHTKIAYYSTQGHFAQQLSVSAYWLEKARDHAQAHPQDFDAFSVSSLDSLIKYITTGDEHYFKEHSIAWLQTNNRLDYTWGFIETYSDPKSARGMFQAEATVKTVKLTQLALMLPAIERVLPVPDEFKRESLANKQVFIPNASINTQLWGTGELGPLYQVAAYCLPNYEDIRATIGSKQIMYHTEKSLAQKMRPELQLELSYTHEQVAWLRTYDPQRVLVNDLDLLQTILHETIGHASGKLAVHTLSSAEILTREWSDYSVGAQVPVTDSNIKEFLAGTDHTLEELRAEIIALYVSVNHLDELASTGLLGTWGGTLSKQELQEWAVLTMAYAGLSRFIRQPDDAQEISGDHARANNTITNYLLAHSALELVLQEKELDGVVYTVPGLRITSLSKAQDVIEKLMVLTQEIKSTANGTLAQELINQYGKTITNRKAFQAIKDNYKALVGPIKGTAVIYPHYTPVSSPEGELQDITAGWPQDIYEQQITWSKIAFTKNY